MTDFYTDSTGLFQWMHHDPDQGFTTHFEQGKEQFCTLAKSPLIDSLKTQRLPGAHSTKQLSTMYSCSFGSKTPKTLLTLCAGTHGAEWLVAGPLTLQFMTKYIKDNDFRQLLDHNQVKVLVIFNVNPEGSATHRRTTYGGVDLNRNGIEHTSENTNPDYARYHQAMLDFSLIDYGSILTYPDFLFYAPISLLYFLAAIIQFSGILGETRRQSIKQTIHSGQGSHPNGLFYQGKQIEPALLAVETLVNEQLEQHDFTNVVLWDVHTGVGQPGEAIGFYECPKPPSAAFRSQLAEKVTFDTLEFRADGGSHTDSSRFNGDWIGWLQGKLELTHPQLNCLPVMLELGTTGKPLCSLQAISTEMADTGDRSTISPRVKATNARAFCPNSLPALQAIENKFRLISEQLISSSAALCEQLSLDNQSQPAPQASLASSLPSSASSLFKRVTK